MVMFNRSRTEESSIELVRCGAGFVPCFLARSNHWFM